MSENNRGQRPRYSPNHFSRALDIVRSILDDQPLSHPVSPSGELYRVIERYHRGMDRVAESTRRSLNTATSSANDTSIPPSLSNNNAENTSNNNNTNPSSINYTGIGTGAGNGSGTGTGNMSGNSNHRRSNTSSAPASQDPREPRLPPSLPPLRFFGTDPRRSSNMSSDRHEDQSSFRRRSALSTISSFIRADSNQSQGHDQDRDRDRYRARTDLDDLFHLLPGIPTSDSNYVYMNDTNPATINPALISSPVPEDYHNDSRRIKRRKLDTESLLSSKSFRYGYFGQVEPGELKMELVSCDGGMYEGDALYPAENILKDDNSVYCTKGNRCNILLRHQGATIFTLKELVIKAPGTDFDAPIRNGFVFVSMADDEILSRTAKYQIQYKTSARDEDSRENNPSHPDRARGLSSSFHPQQTEATFSSILMGSEADQLYMHPRPQPWTYTLSEGLGLEDEENENENEPRAPREEEREAQIPQEFNMDSSVFNVVTECSDDEEAGLGRMRSRRAPNRIGSLPFESDSDDGRTPFGTSYDNFEDIARWRRREQQRRHESGESGLAEAAEEHQHALQEAVRAVGGTLLKPLAKFSMEKDKSKCTIKFDPPASARFLLLKIWNPTHDPTGNIDIKAVVVKGFAGPRYFPSVQPR